MNHKRTFKHNFYSTSWHTFACKARHKDKDSKIKISKSKESNQIQLKWSIAFEQ